jgi:hypothetical protein
VSVCCGELPERLATLEAACEPQSSEASGRFLHGGHGSAHRHRGRAPSLHVPAYAPHRAHGILDDYTRRTVLMAFSMMLVQASERRSSFGNPSRVTVRISSMPSSIERNPSRVTVRISSMPSSIEPAARWWSFWALGSKAVRLSRRAAHRHVSIQDRA